MVAIRVEVKDAAVMATLHQLQARVTNTRSLLASVGERLLTRIDARFTSQTDPDGHAWQPLSAATLRSKRAGKPILTDRGDLRRSIVRQVTGGSSLVLSSSEPYAAIQHFGGTIQREARQTAIRHRTDAKGNLLRTAIMGGRGLVFAKASHKRALERTVTVGPHAIVIPARPYFPVRPDGTIYAADQAAILDEVNRWLALR